MDNTISFHTLGCRLNQAETAAIQNSCQAHGYRLLNAFDPSDIVVINTCTVTENGDADTRRLVNRIARRNPKTRIALIGCQAQIQKDKLAGLSNVRWIVGNQHKMDLAGILSNHPNPVHAEVITPAIDRKPFVIPETAFDRTHKRANIKIQDGCDFFCSFCEIPYARGRARSRVFSDVLKEAAALADAGHKELVLTGINIGTYQYEDKNLLDILEALERIESVKRIRISSIEPTTIPREIFEFMQPGRKLCRHLHIPLQSGDDVILAAMKRKYSSAEFARFVNEAYEKVPGICIGTDVIVGFPGETDQSFSVTESFLREWPVHYFHVFSYSPRYMAQSRSLRNVVNVGKVQERSQILRQLSERKRNVFYQGQTGAFLDVICEHRKGDFWVGLSDNYVKIKTKSSENLSNQMLRVQVETVEEQCVSASIYESSKSIT